MLDKSVPYVGLFMRRKGGTPIQGCPLPDGYRFSLYSGGDETSWARIETSVLEFDNEFAAIMYFTEKFMIYPDELRRRCLFIETDSGEKVATATAWRSDAGGKSHPWLQWVGVSPHHQGLGLGKALISKVTALMMQLDGDCDFYLHTQTWSYKAVNIYKANGFEPTDEKALYKDRRDNYKKALRILARVEKKRR